jgi:hypothetical protein
MAGAGGLLRVAAAAAGLTQLAQVGWLVVFAMLRWVGKLAGFGVFGCKGHTARLEGGQRCLG